MNSEIQKRAEEIGKQNAHGAIGLTKLELFAGMAMQGLAVEYSNTVGRNDMVNESVTIAKALCYALAEAEMKEVQP